MGVSVNTGEGIKAEPNVVPMIDVMLVLLIIFMVVTPAITSGFQAISPEGVNIKEHPEEETDQVLGIDRFGNYYLNKLPISAEELPGRLKAIFENREDRVLYLKADRSLEYGKVLVAMDIASNNGVYVVGAITEQVPGTESTVPGDKMKRN